MTATDRKPDEERVDAAIARVQDWAGDTVRGDYLDEDIRTLLSALAAERDRADRAEAKLYEVSEVVRTNGSATAQKIVEILAIKATA